jgi:hypothetical protein
MRTHRFGQKIKLPATIAIKHQIRKLMFEDAVKTAEAGARAERAIELRRSLQGDQIGCRLRLITDSGPVPGAGGRETGCAPA